MSRKLNRRKERPEQNGISRPGGSDVYTVHEIRVGGPSPQVPRKPQALQPTLGQGAVICTIPIADSHLHVQPTQGSFDHAATR
jgi:hypothetical protein